MKLNLNNLYIVSTPIGNLDDITLRAIEVLKESDIIICEDTRRSLKLLNHLKIKKKLISYHLYNEKIQISKIIKYINDGKILSLISDAGTPILSDPGRLLINECIKNKIEIVPVPGVSSITSAMSVSGFRDQFLFYGFLPKTDNELKKVLNSLEKLPYTQVFFVPAIKVNFYLKRFKNFFSGRKIMIGKELTKMHESFFREDVDKINLFKTPIKGELTIVISDRVNKSQKFNEGKISKMARILFKKYSLRDTVNLIMDKEKANKKKIYQICLKIKNEKNI